MKIAYYLSWSTLNLGVIKKIFTQIKFWKDSGNDVQLFLLTRNAELSEYISSKLETNDYQIENFGGRNVFGRIYKEYKIARNILKSKPDLFYFRFDLYSPVILFLLKKLNGIIEVNSDSGEFKVNLNKICLKKFIYIYLKLLEKFILKYVKGCIFLTKALMEKHANLTKNKALVISNGIDLSAYNSLPITQATTPNLLFIGSEPAPWHGIDKIIKLAEMIPGWNFNLIGNLFEKKLCLDLPANVFFHGFLEPKSDKYTAILQNSNVAIGTVALHRKNMDEASPLKVREYLANGLPVILGYCDTDIAPNANFALTLPNNENNIIENIDKIKTFVERWHGKRVPRSDVMDIDAKSKENKRLKFFKKMLDCNRL